MRILFLHGWTSVPGGKKPTFLSERGHDVINPALPDDFFESVRVAEAEYNEHQPDVIVGSSRGGAVAINMQSGDTPLVLLCSAWKKWGDAHSVKTNCILLHSTQDDVVPFADSEELLDNSGVPRDALIHVGADHRLVDDDSLVAINWACEYLGSGERPSWLETTTQPPARFFENEAAFVDRVNSEIVPRIEKSTIPFYHLRKNPLTNQHDVLAKDRTGVLVRIGDDHFVLTASHEIKESLEQERFLYMSWDDEEECPIPIAEDQIVTTDTATLDVAAIKLSEKNAEQLLAKHSPTCLSHITRDGRSSSGLYLILGFPRAGTLFQCNPLDENPKILTESLKYIGTRKYDGWERNELKHSPLIHLIVGMNRCANSSSRSEEDLPDHAGIEGISGCGIWHLADKAWGKRLDEIRCEDVKLIAIEHSYDEAAGKVASTWMDLVLGMLAVAFPETYSTINPADNRS